MRNLDLRKQLKLFAKGLIKGVGTTGAKAANVAPSALKKPKVGKLPSMVTVDPKLKNKGTGVREISKKLKSAKATSKKSHDGSYNKKMFPPVVDYSGKIVTPGYDPKKAELYKKNARKNARK